MFAAYLAALWVGAGMLIVIDASFNIAMEPLRALVADKLPTDQRTLRFSVQKALIGIGIAWASILAMPYAILAGSIPARKMGVYMGIFNFFIPFPQIVNGIFGGPIVKYLYGGQAVYALTAAGVLMIAGAVSVIFVKDKDDVVNLLK